MCCVTYCFAWRPSLLPRNGHLICEVAHFSTTLLQRWLPDDSALIGLTDFVATYKTRRLHGNLTAGRRSADAGGLLITNPPLETWSATRSSLTDVANGTATTGLQDFRKSVTSFVVPAGFSSIIQCPESGTIASSTSLAAMRITVAIIEPNAASPPIASMGIVSLPLAR
jgi:hypothetical protein